MSLKQHEDKKYITVLADGKLHMTVPDGTEGAVIRKFKNSDGLEGEKLEKVFTQVIGKITNIAFRNGQYGMDLQLTIADKEETPLVLSLKMQYFGEDALKKLPNVDLDKMVKIVPFSFKDTKTGKMKKGITIYQHKDKSGKAQKISNYFYDEKKKENLYGYPEVPASIKKLQDAKKVVPNEKWKLYFGQCVEFLVDFTTKKFDIKETVSATDDDFDKMVEEATAAIE